MTGRETTADNDSRSDEALQQMVRGLTGYAIYLLDLDGRVATWNTGARLIKGYQAIEIIGRRFSCFYTDEDQKADRPAQALRDAATTGRFETEAWRVRKNGDRFWAHVLIEPIHGDDGVVVGFGKVTGDITRYARAPSTPEIRQLQTEGRPWSTVDGVYWASSPPTSAGVVGVSARPDVNAEGSPREKLMSAELIRWNYIQRAYALCDYNVSETARQLNMHRRTLQRRLGKHAPSR
jgi:PAS domain S-box-containing protein